MGSPLLIATILAALGAGLIAGFFLAFSATVMGALRRIEARAGIAAMQSINVVVLNPVFLGTFFGTALLCLVLLVAAVLRWSLQGEPAPGLEARSASLLSGAAYGRVRLLYALAATIAFGLEGIAAWSTATADIVHAERVVARLGHGLASGLVVLEVRAL